MNKVVVFKDLVAELAKITNTSEPLAESFLRELLALMSETLCGDGVFLLPNIGEFRFVNGNVEFAPDASLAEEVNFAFDCFEPVELDDDYSDDDIAEPVNELPAEEVAPIADEPMPLSEELPNEDDEEEILPPPIPDEDKVAVPPVPSETVEPSVPDYVPEQEPAAQPEPETDSEYDYDDNEEPKSRGWLTFIWGFLSGAAALAVVAYVLSLNGIITIGCGVAQEKNADILQSDSVMTAVAAVVDSVVPVPVPTEQVVDTVAKTEEKAKPEVKPVKYKVTKTSYLSNISRKYYGHYVFWIYIYLENKDIIKDADNLPVGMELIIPPAEKYGIDKNDPESIERAKKMAEKTFPKK